MLRIPCSHCVYSMSPAHPPVATARPGETVVFETMDCHSNIIRAETDPPDSVPWERINPATGPLRVEGARPGDVLKVDILALEVDDQGCMTATPGRGALGRHVDEPRTKIVRITGAGGTAAHASPAGSAPTASRAVAESTAGEIIWNGKLRLPCRPMIGVIGVSPASGEIPTGTPGAHGGNMDTKLITAGTTLYLPVFVEGANLCLGDLHALMADGEVVICGVEVAGEVTLRVDVLKAGAAAEAGSSAEAALAGASPDASTVASRRLLIGGPVLETPGPDGAFYCIASGKDLDEAVERVLDMTFAFLKARLPLPATEIAMLMSVLCDLAICQVVDPLKTVRMGVPKAALSPYGLAF